MASIPKKVAERLVVGIKRFQPILAAAKARDVGEADTVTIVKDMLSDVFGYPPRQNSCRSDMILNLGAIRMKYGTVRRSIQEQSGGAVTATGERQCGFGGERNWSDGANIGTMA